MSRSRLLVLLLILLSASLWYAWRETPRQQKVSGERSPVRSRTVAVIQNDGVTDTAADDVLAAGEHFYNEPKRDLFRLLYPAPVYVAPPVTAPQPVPIVAAPAPPPPKPPPVQPPATGTKPIPPLNVLGFLQKGPVTTVFLTSRQGELYLVKKGDRFADDLLVRELDGTKIVISRGQDDVGVTLTVGGQKTVRMKLEKVSSGRPSVPDYVSPEPATEDPPSAVEIK